ncbi:uncharacterized protein LOC134249308 [Saccostrea cucullata]|uniref:uncharacterized protein LOC134249308 n=1 Tax=Saccostrea cuccullata TaxID=36930 RepID=UPI002ED49B8D
MMAQEQGKTKITDLQHLITLTSSDNMSMHHLKVSRGLYDHHYILLGHKWEDEACEIIHYTVNTDLNVIGKGIAKKEMLSREQLKADIEKELYIINNDAYPRNSEAIATAWSRWRGREGETRYYVSASNCENLVTYILTGVSQSEQWNLAGFFKRALGDSIDVLICEWLETLLKGCASILVSPLLRRHSKKFATEINEKLKARNWASRAAVRFINIFRQSPMTRVPKFLKNS